MKLIAFDMDGTLIRNTDSVAFLCRLCGVDPGALAEINSRESSGAISWIEADYARVRLIRGLPLGMIREAFDTHIQLISGLGAVMDHLRKKNYRAMLVTAGPRQVADILSERYRFDDCFGSDYEVIDGRFTGRIRSHMGSLGKAKCLQRICLREGIHSEDCVAVGDSASDIGLFQSAGRSIAINFSPELKPYATHAIRTNDLPDILPLLD